MGKACCIILTLARIIIILFLSITFTTKSRAMQFRCVESMEDRLKFTEVNANLGRKIFSYTKFQSHSKTHLCF